MSAEVPEVMLSWPQVRPLVGNLGRTTWWRMMGRGEAPKPVHLSPGRVAWPQSAIAAFQAARLGGAPFPPEDKP